MEKTDELTEQEILEILKRIARDGHNGAARIAAIREYRSIRGGEKPADDTIAKLYAVPTRRSGTGG